jgi:hypothetical protein
VLVTLALSALISAAPAPSVRYVSASQAKLREGPTTDSRSAAMVPTAAELKVLGRSGAFLEVETLKGDRGYVLASLLSKTAPTLAPLLEEADAKRGRKRLRALERATALAPSDLAVIERLEATLDGLKKKTRVYYARKGWVAAKRRSFMWDGPLYPVADGIARFPAPCAAHQDKPTGPNGMEKGDLDEETRVLRTRAFPWVSSGKVVSVSERGYTTQKLSTLACDGGQLAYELPKQAREGALVPSWMVAGFTVTPVKRGEARSARRRVSLDVEGRALKVRASTFTKTREGALTLRRAARPVAVFSEGPGSFALLLIADGGRACAPGEKTASLVRATVEGDGLKLEQGRAWSSAFVEGCAQETFAPLPGEPRDISKQSLLSDGWRR